jgi:uncharacterized delta-60 repeat protein
VGAAVLALALAFAGGCGDETEKPEPGPDDSGTNTTDGGTDGGVTFEDTEFAVARFNTNGTLDTTFGTSGVAHVNVGPGIASARESLWGMTRDNSDRLVLFGTSKGKDRFDVDRVVVRLTANGAVDTTFATATSNVHSLNIGNLADNGRHGIVQPDGKIVASGYISQPTGVGAQSANRVVLVRLNEDGTQDNSFGSKGVVNSAPYMPVDYMNTEWGMAEAYAVGYQGGKYVTAGYGRPGPSGTVDIVSFRYTETGQLDTTWGSQGIFNLGLAGDDRGRHMAVLPDNRVFIVGSGTAGSQNIDALALMLTPEGQRDTSYSAEGYKLFTFNRADEAFFGAAVSPNRNYVAAAGYVAGGSEDDDALLYLLPLGGGNEFIQTVPLSETAPDRFWAVAFDSAGKVYGAGHVTENGDSRMAVARFNADGSRDTGFGTNGVVTLNVIEAGTVEQVRAIAIQSDGKVVVAGTVEKK